MKQGFGLLFFRRKPSSPRKGRDEFSSEEKQFIWLDIEPRKVMHVIKQV